VFDRHGLYGVKRVPRRPDAPLRRYIDQLGDRLGDRPGDRMSDELSDEQGSSLP
jgi:hypothetical protein